MSRAAELIRNVQDSFAKKIDPKLKESVALLIRHESAKLQIVLCNGVKLYSNIDSLTV